MAVTYHPCGKHVDNMIADVMKRYHEPLVQYGVTVSSVFAALEKDEEPEYALKKNGFIIAAKIQITSLSDRARGQADAKLTICELSWDRMSETARVALLDHELQHLMLKFDKEKGYYDDLGRPRLKIRPHDWELTGFAAVVRRHGESAVESREIAKFKAEHGEQLGFWPTAEAA